MIPQVENERSTQRFGENSAKYSGSGHSGIDYGVNYESVYAAKRGFVVKIRYNNTGYGTYIVLLHEDGSETIYAHLSKILVENRQTVEEDDVIAISGNTGMSTGPHLHFGYRPLDADLHNGYSCYIDPINLFEMSRIEYMSKLSELEKQVGDIKKSLEYPNIRQVEGGEVIIHPQFKNATADAVMSSVLARHSGQPLLKEADAKKLKKDGWMPIDSLRK